MIYAVCGPLSSHSVLVTQVTKAVLEFVYSEVFFFETNDSNTLKEAVVNRTSDNCLFVFDTPDESIAKSVIKNRIPTILVTEPFVDLCCYAMHQYGVDLMPCIRTVTRSISALHPIAASPTTIPIPVFDEMDLVRLVGRIAISLDLKLREDEIHAITRGYAENEIHEKIFDVVMASSQKARLARESKAILLPHELRMLSQLSGAYDPLLAGASTPLLHWPIETMIQAEPPYSQLSGPIDLTGPGRILTFGPYFHLPKGRWRAELTFSVTENLSGNIFLVDIYANADTVLVAAKGDLPVGGTFTTRLEFEIGSALHMIEVRTFVLTGAIEGNFELLNLALQKLGDDRI